MRGWTLVMTRLRTARVRRLTTGARLRRPTPLWSSTPIGWLGAKRIRRGRQTHRHTFTSETLSVTTQLRDQTASDPAPAAQRSELSRTANYPVPHQ